MILSSLMRSLMFPFSRSMGLLLCFNPADLIGTPCVFFATLLTSLDRAGLYFSNPSLANLMGLRFFLTLSFSGSCVQCTEICNIYT